MLRIRIFVKIKRNIPFRTRNVPFSEEATLSLNVPVSTHNSLKWRNTKPYFSVETLDQYAFKTNVRCAIINYEKTAADLKLKSFIVSYCPQTTIERNTLHS